MNNFRNFIKNIHLYLGLVSCIILFIVCLSGTIYTFRSEIEYLIEPSKYNADTGKNKSSELINPAILIETTERQTMGKAVGVKIPYSKNKTWQISIKKTAGKDDERPEVYFVNPYDAEIKGSGKGPASEFFLTVMKIHRWLFLKRSAGRVIVGTATIIFTALLLTGLILWVPRKFKGWKRVLTIKTDARGKRLNHDLHNTLGFYCFIPLLIMALTGLCWSFDWYREGLGGIMGDKVFKAKEEKPVSLNMKDTMPVKKLSLADLAEKINVLLPYKGDISIRFPNDSLKALMVSKNKIGFWAPAAPDKIQLDPYSGSPLKMEIFKDKPLNEKIVSLIKPLHVGDVFGMFSKIIYFFACLVGTSLPLTGIIIYINKLR